MLAFFFILNKLKFLITLIFTLAISKDYISDEKIIIFNDLKKNIHVNESLNWNIVDIDGNVTISNYKSKYFRIPAIKVEIIDSVNYLYLKKAIVNVKDHVNFMQDSYLKVSDSLHYGLGDFYDKINLVYYDTYQYLDLPFINDRDYIARTNIYDNENNIRLNWELLSIKYKYYYNVKDYEFQKNSLFIEDGFGYWNLERIDNYITKATYVIYLNPKGWIPSFVINMSNRIVVPNTVKNMIKEAKRLEKLD